MRVALHACCGPCLLEPLDAIAEQSERVVVVYANPNIHPRDEYRLRRDSLVAYAEKAGLEVHELEYDADGWMADVGVHGTNRRLRCQACYQYRLRMVASWAAENGYDTIATTLTVSPYQDAAAIAVQGMAAAEELGVAYLDRDFRDRYPEATRRSRDLGMYRQNYCGCMFSIAEAEAEREDRREARRQAKLLSRPDDAEPR